MKFLGPLAFGLSLIADAASAQTPVPIPNAGNWRLLTSLPDVQKPVCSARANGPEADTILILNNGQLPMLMIGRADWTDLLGPVDIKLSVDGGKPRPLKGQMLYNLILIPPDRAFVDSLRDAKSLDWTLPFGSFRANVLGLGAAFDAVVACGAKLHTH